MTDRKKIYSGIAALLISILLLNAGIFVTAIKGFGSGWAIILFGGIAVYFSAVDLIRAVKG